MMSNVFSPSAAASSIAAGGGRKRTHSEEEPNQSEGGRMKCDEDCGTTEDEKNHNDDHDDDGAVDDDEQSVGDADDELVGEGTVDEMSKAVEADAAFHCDDDDGTDAEASVIKRKGRPRKIVEGQLETTAILSERHGQRHGGGSDDELHSDDEESDSGDGGDDESSTSSEGGDDDPATMIDSLLRGNIRDGHDRAAMIASLLRGEDGDAVRAYLARFDASDDAAASDMPEPPSFPDGIADYMRSERCKSIVVLAGAGMSVSCGIPDFRSAGVGLYDTLRPELLTATELERALIEGDPTLALDKGMFLQNPLPMLETKRSFIIGTHEKRWRATLAHRFVELLHTKLGKLTRLYTQNIDGLEFQTGLPRERVVNVHGSMGAAACELCGHEMDFDDFTKAEFHTRTAEDLPDVDLLIIMGTSLTVAPANSLVYRIPPTALRMVMNDERVGRRLGIDYGEDAVRDVWARGHTDETCLDLAEKMGWLDDLALIVDELPDTSGGGGLLIIDLK
ncbi:hypothetical protein ACHAW5_004879 [Stephanodiscus triporus]|uniref:Deacetylase sirtuin-type domain-containing protein n=1 Tax=Stephanodiscus triporus TaxID=2934178 RepID=A0ABD3P5A2_9STRA